MYKVGQRDAAGRLRRRGAARRRRTEPTKKKDDVVDAEFVDVDDKK